MLDSEMLFFDSTTKTYFKSTVRTINLHVWDIFAETYHGDTRYVDLIRDLQDRLGIPMIVDEELCRKYSMWDGRMLNVNYDLAMTNEEKLFFIITYYDYYL